MKPSRLASGILALLYPALLVGCGMFDFEEREPWRAQAEAACYARHLVKLTPLIQEVGSIEGKGICGLDRPLKVAALADGSMSLGSRPLVMSCPMTAALERWLNETVAPAAYARYGVPVVEIKNFGTYNCRSRNNVPGARLSEHAFANAFDFAGVVLANGYVVTVKKGWRGSESDRAFLREIAAGACGPFTTVLGPGSDGVHEDHLHLDLARHNAKGTYRYCKPRPEVPGATSPVFSVQNEAPPADVAVWPKVLPQSIAAADRAPVPVAASQGYQQPLPPATIGSAALPASIAPLPAANAAATAASAPQPAGCPAGYICTPVSGQPGSAEPAPPVGWSVGAPPVQGYSDADITGSIGGYSDE